MATLGGESDSRFQPLVDTITNVWSTTKTMTARSALHLIPDATIAHTDAWRAATIGAANGHGNARSVAQIQAVVSNGGSSHGVQILSPETIDRIFEEQWHGVDQVLMVPVRFGLGYCLAAADNPIGVTTGKKCFWGGWGGSIVLNDLDNRITLTYMMNRMQAGLVGNETSGALIAALDAITAG